MRKKRKKGSVWPLIALIAVLCAVLWLLLSNVVFVVREVQVVGAGDVPEADVRHLSGIRLGTRMSALDEARIRLDVESDGRVAFVSLARRYPSRVELNVRPRTMDALILLGGKILVLDSDAYVVQLAEQLPAGHVPYVSGIKATHYALGRQLDLADGRCLAMKAVLEALKAQGKTAYVSELNVSNTEDLRVITRTGIEVLLGNSQDMARKITWMAGALADLENRGQTSGTLDVSSATKADFRPAATPEAQAQAEPEATEAPTAPPVEAPAS